MKLRQFAVAAAAALGMFATSASAADAITAKLQAPLEGSKKPIAGSAVFLCAADTCVASNPSGDTLSRSACRQLVKAVGAVSSYGTEAKQLSAEQLAGCNASAKK